MTKTKGAKKLTENSEAPPLALNAKVVDVANSQGVFWGAGRGVQNNSM